MAISLITNLGEHDGMAIAAEEPSQAARPRRQRTPNHGHRREAEPVLSSPQMVMDFLRGFNELSLGDVVAMLRQAGFKRHPKITEQAEKLLGRSNEFHIESDIVVLEQAGIARELLGIAMAGIGFTSEWDRLNGSFGHRRVRQRKRRSLLAALRILKQLGNDWALSSESTHNEAFSPLGVATGLERYADMLEWRDWLFRFAGVDSLLDLAKYALAGSVKRISGTYHDREVSALIGVALESSDYHTEAHRFWRKRMYARLDRSLPFAARALQAANSILIQS